MIIGLGTDLVEIDRFAQILGRHPQRLLERILGAEERLRWESLSLTERGRAAWLAKRFAAKEAAAKALGTGFRAGITLRDIQTVHDPLGRPQLTLSGAARSRYEQMAGANMLLSVSDEHTHALAFVVIESA